MLIPAEYKNDPDGPKGLLTHVRLPGQRWFHLACFGRKSHYYEDGGCDHTDALYAVLTDYGKTVTKLQPFGAGKCKPKRPRKRPVNPPPASTDEETESP